MANIHRFMKILKLGLLAAVGIFLVAGEMIMSCAVKREMTFMAQCFRFAVTDEWKNTKLHSAALFADLPGRLGEMRTLLAVGADVNAKNTVGWTPLHLAARIGHTEAARLLLAAGADVNAKDKDGHTPLHGAAENGHTDVVNLLRAHGAKE